MERLSSCYFCGADAPLGEYPAVPRDLDPDPDDQAEVTLCPTCRRKLATVVGRVVDAAGAEAEPAVPERPTADAEGAPESAEESTMGESAVDRIPDAGDTSDEGPAEGRSAADVGEPEDDPEATPGQSVSALEHNRVMRLLENRTFPVGREEAIEVARGAYDLPRSEVEDVIDAAIEEGLLAERDGELVRP